MAGRVQSWRWLALGVFYPRAKRFAAASNFRRVDLSDNALEVEYVEALAKTLQDPARELVYLGKDSSHRVPSTEGKLIVCLVKPGAKLFETPQEEATVISKMAIKSHLEVLC